MSLAFWNGIVADHAASQLRVSVPVAPLDTYRGWLIEENWLGQWEATGPNFDARYESEEDGWAGNGQCVTAPTRAALIEEIDAWFEEHVA